MSAHFTCDSRSGQKNLSRSAYTLLELMIALGLLGALLAVGWSLIGNYQSAEVRSWNLVHRANATRLTRSWLQHDLQRISLVAMDEAEDSFWGTESELEFAVHPTLSPVAVFSQYLDAQSQLGDSLLGEEQAFLEPTLTTTLPSFDRVDSSNDEQDSSSIRDPFQSQGRQDRWLVSYRLEEDSRATTLLQEDSAEVVRVYSLVRQERLPKASASSSGEIVDVEADELLTIEDLYRTDENDVSETASTTVVAEQKLEGLLNAEFQYFDGKSWSKQWIAPEGDIPAAVALQFDFPTPGQMRKLSAPRPTMDPEEQLSTFDTELDSVLSREPVAEREAEEVVDSPLNLSVTSKSQMLVIVQLPQVSSRSEPDRSEELLP